ncbi:hypothetical protein QW131_23495 [Roseibium salinum]|nr:hypothetical protein [Roseibium salinum]
MANIVEGGETPDLPHKELEDLGFAIAAYPLTLMASAMKAMVHTLERLKSGQDRTADLMDFGELRERIGFNDYYEVSSRYETSRRD